MKKVLAMLIVGAIAGTAAADLTQFSFRTGLAQNQGVDFDAWSFLVFQGNASTVNAIISGSEIDESSLDGLGLSLIGAPASEKLVFEPVGTLKTAYIIGDGSLAGDIFGMLVNQSGVTTVAGINQGAYIALTTDFVVTDLRPGGPGTTAGTPEDFNPGTVNANVQVVPEPATVGLFGLGALSAWIIRRNKKKATEEA